jgi:hypothetical protein
MKNELELIAQVEKQLREGKWNYEREPVIGAARPDFVVTTETGDQIVLEVKAWKADPESTARALHQAQRYKKLSRAEAALIVTATSQAVSLGLGGIVPIAGLVPALIVLQQQLATKSKSRKKQPTAPSPKKKIFASMPFAMQYDDTFLVGIQPAALNLGAVAERVDHNGQAGNVVAQIQAVIKAAKVIVADLSDSRPNVLHEVGYAEALGKTIIQICSTPTSASPFNVRNNQTIQYSIGQTSKLRRRLETELQKVI